MVPNYQNTSLAPPETLQGYPGTFWKVQKCQNWIFLLRHKGSFGSSILHDNGKSSAVQSIQIQQNTIRKETKFVCGAKNGWTMLIFYSWNNATGEQDYTISLSPIGDDPHSPGDSTYLRKETQIRSLVISIQRRLPKHCNQKRLSHCIVHGV